MMFLARSVFLGSLFGPGGALPPAATIFITASALIPSSPNLSTDISPV
jgi:hypothetical protein